MSKPLHNYLRMFRRSAGLTQKEVAYLLGVPHPSQISRMERSVREPNLQTLLAYELLFRTPGRRLFAGLFEEVEKRTTGRAKRLLARLDKLAANAQLDRKRETLNALIEGQVETLGLPTFQGRSFSPQPAIWDSLRLSAIMVKWELLL